MVRPSIKHRFLFSAAVDRLIILIGIIGKTQGVKLSKTPPSAALSTPETIAGDMKDLLSPVSEKPAVEIVKVRTAWSLDMVNPGSHVILAVIFDIAKDFHINADKNQIILVKDLIPFPTRVQVIEASEGIMAEAPQFPQAHPLKVDFADKNMMFFTGQAVIYLSTQAV